MSEYKLCYVKDNFAYFTSQELKNQCGDGWHKRPYEHNSDEPYVYCGKGKPYGIVKMAFEGEFRFPLSRSANSQYSVDSINAGDFPWIAQDEMSIYAGASIEEFKEKIIKADGSVYVVDNTKKDTDVYKLCYIKDSFAYFTTDELSKQDGDCWDRIAYDFESEEPYPRHSIYKIDKVAFESELLSPPTSCFSVNMINRGAVAWLFSATYHNHKVVIPAGVPIEKFDDLVKEAGGNVYYEI